jgi:hypothetical protein
MKCTLDTSTVALSVLSAERTGLVSRSPANRSGAQVSELIHSRHDYVLIRCRGPGDAEGMATMAQRTEAEDRLRVPVVKDGPPPSDRVEYGFTRIRHAFNRTKHGVIFDLSEPRMAMRSISVVRRRAPFGLRMLIHRGHLVLSLRYACIFGRSRQVHQVDQRGTRAGWPQRECRASLSFGRRSVAATDIFGTKGPADLSCRKGSNANPARAPIACTGRGEREAVGRATRGHSN